MQHLAIDKIIKCGSDIWSIKLREDRILLVTKITFGDDQVELLGWRVLE